MKKIVLFQVVLFFLCSIGFAADVTRWHYHEATGLVTGKEDAIGNMVQYTYEPVRRLKTRTWARKINTNDLVTTYNYDPATTELFNIDYSDDTPDIGFTYDRLGRIKTVTDAVGSRSFIYNNSSSELERETITGIYNAEIVPQYETATGVQGRYSGLSIGSDYVVNYGYESTTGRLNTVSWNVNGSTGTIQYSYIPNSNLIGQVTASSGHLVTYTYEPDRNIQTQAKNLFGPTVISQYDYVNDVLGRRSSVVNSGTAFPTSGFNNFGYNDRSELTESSRYNGSNINDLSNPVQAEYRSFLYDNAGNRNGITKGTTNHTYTTNELNQYTEESINSVGTNSFTYDNDGNLVQISGLKNLRLSYNGENRLVKVEPVGSPVVGDRKVEYSYDYKGRRVRKAEFVCALDSTWPLNPTVDRQFVYDQWNLVQEIINDGATEKRKYYIWGLDKKQTLHEVGGVGALLAVIDGANTYQYCYDSNGNVTQLVNMSNGSIAAHYEYDPYGNTITATGAYAAENPFRFSSKYTDDETGFIYYGFRYYYSDLGRWINRDPIEENGFLRLTFNNYDGNFETNLYAFVLNNSLNSYDPHGLAVETGWDLFNVGTGVLSLGCNISSGNVLGAVVDVGGLVYDLTATAVPFLPGGASAGIKTIRLAKASRGLAKAMMVKARAAKNSNTLVRYVLTTGDQAHHIIAKAAKAAKPARDKLAKLGIDIDDAVNGVSLPKGSHSHLHTNAYYDMINEASRLWNSKQDAIKGLGKIAERLLKRTGKLK